MNKRVTAGIVAVAIFGATVTGVSADKGAPTRYDLDHDGTITIVDIAIQAQEGDSKRNVKLINKMARYFLQEVHSHSNKRGGRRGN